MAPFEWRTYLPPARESYSHRALVGISSTLSSLCVRNETDCMQDLFLSFAKNCISNIYIDEVMLPFINHNIYTVQQDTQCGLNE